MSLTFSVLKGFSKVTAFDDLGWSSLDSVDLECLGSS